MRMCSRRIFDSALEAVLPPAMVHSHLKRDGDSLFVGGKSYKLSNNVYLVGFGKAVSGMCRAVQDRIGDHIVRGILSVPVDTTSTLTNTNKRFLLPKNDGRITMYEGALNNLPDDSSHSTTKKIVHMLEGLTEKDIVLALISGGGSALLCSPLPPLTLKEKKDVTALLAKQGASIQELNTIRKHLSEVKGGRLAKAAFPAKVISLILSDIIGDPLDLIASGPTVPSISNTGHCLEVLRKFNALNRVPKTVLKILEASSGVSSRDDSSQVQNVLVGTNSIAVDAAVAEAENLGYRTFVLSKKISGEAREVGGFFIDLARVISESQTTRLENPAENLARKLLNQPQLAKFIWKDDLHAMLQELFKDREVTTKKLCIIGAGETTVTVRGSGKGGRNQEMVLAAAIQHFQQRESFPDLFTISFLSAGTDGQDGPTDVAGAVFDNHGSGFIRNEAELTEAQDSLANNDSYHFLARNTVNVLKTGITGTNVMDLHILTMKL